MVTYYPIEGEGRLDAALRQCRSAGKALDAGEYVDELIADPHNETRIWNTSTFVDSWRIGGRNKKGEPIAMYVHAPLFTDDEFKDFFSPKSCFTVLDSKLKIYPDGAFDLSTFEDRVRRLIEEGQELSLAARMNPYDAPRKVWYLDIATLLRSVSLFDDFSEVFRVSETVIFLNGRKRAQSYRDIVNPGSPILFPKTRGVINKMNDSYRDSFVCRPLYLNGRLHADTNSQYGSFAGLPNLI